MDRVQETLANVVLRFYQHRKKMKVWEWIDQNCELPPESGAKLKGKFRTGVTPYTRGIYEAYGDHAVRFITLAKSAQVGGTTILKNLVLWDIENKPGPGLYVTANEKMAKRFNDRELEPHFQYCAVVEQLAVRKRGLWSKLEKLFKNGATLGLIGSNSPSNLASRPVETLKMDEVDKWPEESNKEAPADQLAEARTKTYEDVRKVFTISTPTVESGALWQRYLKGSQEKFHVPCPHCNFRQELHFSYSKGEGGLWYPEECRREDGTWDLDRVQREARYRCASCDKPIHNNKKRAMTLAGLWVKTNPNAPSDHRSFHISSLASPFETWGGVAKAYLQAENAAGKLHDFWNNYLGLPWVRQATTIKRSAIKEIVEISPRYRRGELPAKPKLLTMTVDVQQENFWWTVRAWDKRGSSYLIDFGSAISYEDLDEISRREYEFGVQKYTVYKAMYDSGYTAKRKSGVYDWCLMSGGKCFPSKGSSKSAGLLHTTRETRITHRKTNLILTHYDDDVYKEELYRRRIKERAGPAWFLPVDITNEYIDQLTAERLVEKPALRGGIELVWNSTRDNHLGDCEKMQLVFGDLVGPYLKLEEPEEELDETPYTEPLLQVDTPPPEWS